MANEPNVSSVPGWPYVYVNPDGTAIPVDIDSIGSKTNSPVQVPLAASTYVDDFTALQLGMWMILNALEFTTIDRLALVTSGRIESNTMNFTRIFWIGRKRKTGQCLGRRRLSTRHKGRR